MPAEPTPSHRNPHSDPHSDSHSATDLRHMQAALALAEQAIGLTEPNPRVGCVLVAQDGRVIGRGHTQQAGGPHAEVMALREARAQPDGGAALRGATAYVTLEPCAHHGRTPPCCDALIEAGVGRVVAALRDPNPLVAGQGRARLAAAGIAVSCGLLAEPARELNIGFLSRMQRGRPWLRMKLAASLDGRTALPDGTSQWITSAPARADGHAWRRRAGALLTGSGTVLADDPRLDVRLIETPRQPLRVVLDRQLRTPPGARILQPPGATLIYTDAASAESTTATTLAALPGVTLQPVACGADGRLDLAAVLADLGRRGVNELHVEAGQHLSGAFVQAGLVDELLLYLAPKLLGPGLDLLQLPVLARLADAPQLCFTDLARVGPDLRLLARPLSATPDWLMD
ncbi:MAG: bifunctional diaminohydroxyphosphoribosylaminopyrimidine deaminase/5-amino-6-(5-phosphoribosylamino)uracil reductase RibD [Leptothrix sp. (in: b-proteobacteria)]